MARREAVEEAGLVLGRLLPITRYLPSPGGSDELVHLYLGSCDSEGAGGIHGLPDEGEDIRVHVWTWTRRWRGSRTVASATPRPSSPCSGWR